MLPPPSNVPHARKSRPRGDVHRVQRRHYGFPSVGSRLAMRRHSVFGARDRVIGSRLTHNGSLGYIHRGRYAGSRRQRAARASVLHYLPRVLAALAIVVALGTLGYAVQSGWGPFGATEEPPRIMRLVDGAQKRSVMPVEHARRAALGAARAAQAAQETQNDTSAGQASAAG